MARGELVLSEEEQRLAAVTLIDGGLFGIKENPDDYITLKSRRLSPHYMDIRAGLSNYGMRHFIAGTMVNLAVKHTGKDDIGVKYVVGSPEAMTSYAATIADVLMKGLLQPRVALNKASGNKAPILGLYVAGEDVADFDDVVTDGETKIDTINSLHTAGLIVKDYYVVLDREEGGIPQVAEATGLEVTPALGVSSMVKILRSEGRINQIQYDNVARYLTQYGDPHAQEAMNAA